MSRTPVAPGEVHPAYAEDADLIRRWLAKPQHDVIYLPYSSPLYADTDPAPIAPELRKHILTLRKAAGPAPYVGCPFIYVWYVAEDELGRMVAADDSLIKRTCDITNCVNWPPHL
jgi:hypothetical protein